MITLKSFKSGPWSWVITNTRVYTCKYTFFTEYNRPTFTSAKFVSKDYTPNELALISYTYSDVLHVFYTRYSLRHAIITKHLTNTFSLLHMGSSSKCIINTGYFARNTKKLNLTYGPCEFVFNDFQRRRYVNTRDVMTLRVRTSYVVNPVRLSPSQPARTWYGTFSSLFYV